MNKTSLIVECVVGVATVVSSAVTVRASSRPGWALAVAIPGVAVCAIMAMTASLASRQRHPQAIDRRADSRAVLRAT